MQNDTLRVRDTYERFAPRYDRAMGFSERLLFGDGREWVCSRARGEVLEIAAGTGRNLPYYPGDVRLTLVEFSPAMLEIARRRARELGREADLRLGDAQALESLGGSFDTVVITLSLCTIPDDRRAVAEARRVLRPGGRLVLLEHVRSTNPVARLMQRALEPLTIRFQADHLLRDPTDYLEAEGFEVEELERSKLGIAEYVSARKRAA